MFLGRRKNLHKMACPSELSWLWNNGPSPCATRLQEWETTQNGCKCAVHNG